MSGRGPTSIPRPIGGADGQSAVVVVAVAAALLAIVLGALATMGRTSADRTRAQTAADAAALTSVDGGRHDATRLASAHGAVVVSWTRGPGRDEVTVIVRLGDVSATARATDAP